MKLNFLPETQNYKLFIGIVFTIVAGLNALAVTAHGDKKEHKAAQLFSGSDTAAGKVVKQFHHALQSGDEKLAKKLLGKDVLIYESGGIERSAAEYASHHLKADMKFLSQLKVETLEHQVKVIGDMALSTSRSEMKGQRNGRYTHIRTLETIVLKKTDADWRIVHIHWSN